MEVGNCLLCNLRDRVSKWNDFIFPRYVAISPQYRFKGMATFCKVVNFLSCAELTAPTGKPVGAVSGEQKCASDSAVKRIPLTRNGEPITKTYYAFWKKDNSGYYIEDFADILSREFV